MRTPKFGEGAMGWSTEDDPAFNRPCVNPTVLCQDHGKPMIIRVDND